MQSRRWGWLLVVLTGAAGADEPAWQTHESVSACTVCHDGSSDPAELAIFETPHAALGDARTPLARDGCAGCHGESLAHARRPMQPPDLVFRQDGPTPLADRNRLCLDCHQSSLAHWQSSAHERSDLACTDCHTMHATHDAVLSGHSEAETCIGCHTEQRAQIHRPFNHPLADGSMACSDCHAAHGSAGPASLTQRNVNETCYTCHAELRGPFLWEHPPAREDCGHCHQPHGSVHPGMLVSRGPWLCQQCHMAQFHPSTALSGTGLAGDSRPSGSTSVLGQNCLNCHPAVHGSNHPSGAGFTR